jgi:hypothetical protein
MSRMKESQNLFSSFCRGIGAVQGLRRTAGRELSQEPANFGDSRFLLEVG